MKVSLRFEQTSCRLRLDGLPDLSAGQGPEVIGILSGWQLALAGHTELEGKREHLEALLQVVLPYTRHLVSGVPRRFGAEGNPVQIEPVAENGSPTRHRLRLFSSQPDTPPLELRFDDAELSDLVRCLDQLRLDPRVQLGFSLPPERPLPRREILERIPLRQRLFSPVAAATALAITASIGLMVPVPRRPTAPSISPSATPAAPLSPPLRNP
ncbi:DUF4335 domain-containing protein [Synechococcus sp. Tobar12-5m-g]|jgi:hypothetical protein|uniref:DUF4335 domain-containing protein n=1 Tax=unclassified Synechococcus TaxID=2626047 RepID=UPI0020CBB46C|nr:MULTISPECIES: DUF4335 domain-containing protein [unclassified Synechococcus]MCP9771393.1 DUF4335 domain-containing protein [Synechococcus sp. Tobar12-5m-g]MCP9872332.1 DUF4335 domain-containing protein [Synechococcus sp. Cruz CV-v-12]